MTIPPDGENRRRSLEDVHGSVPVSRRKWLSRLFAFLGPAYLVSVGYMDPGNWATDLEGGARFGYALIWVLLMSNAMALILQTLAARLGVVTGHDLAQACRAEYSRGVNVILWLLAEVAIAACDLAEVVGTVIALKLLFGIPMLWGCLVTALDTFLLLWLQRFGMRKMEAAILALVATIGGCFLIQIFQAQPDVGQIVRGAWPSLPPGSLLVAIGILGATVMPHNLYLHSALVQTRNIGADRASKAEACRFNLFDSALALNVAFLVNASILIVSAAVFHRRGVEVASIELAYELLPSFLHGSAPILFGVALLCAGQSSTLTGTLAGQIIMEGYLDLKLAPWLRRMITRTVALVPAVLTIFLAGEGSTQQLLVMSQVVLSLQLSFAVIPLIHFTSNRRNMGEFATPLWGQVLAWLSAVLIVGLNANLVLDKIGEWVEATSASRVSFGPVPASWLVGGVGYGIAAAGFVLLVGVTLKPFIRPSAAWKPKPTLELDWADALRPRQLAVIGVALEHRAGDSEILSRVLSLAEPGMTTLMLLHVVDSPTTVMYGAETEDRETAADRRYLDEVASVLTERGFRLETFLLHGPDRAGLLITHLRTHPVDLLVVGSHGHGLIRDLLFGQTVDKVRHGLEIPMLIARSERSPEAPAVDSLDPLTPMERLF